VRERISFGGFDPGPGLKPCKSSGEGFYLGEEDNIPRGRLIPLYKYFSLFAPYPLA
jgi:hypothetical protein